MRTHTTAVLLAITALLVLPAGALAGGFATVGLSSTPDGLAPGAPWNVELEILQHGRTPLDDVSPVGDDQVRRRHAHVRGDSPRAGPASTAPR